MENISINNNDSRRKRVRMIKLISCDIDGTLIKEATSTIKKEYFTVINKLIEKGVVFAVNTGRAIPEIDNCFRKIRNKVYYCFCNGGGIAFGDKIIRTVDMNKKNIHDLIDFVRYNEYLSKCPIVLNTKNCVQIVEYRDNWFADYIDNTYGSKCSRVSDIHKAVKDIIKTNVYNHTMDTKNTQKICKMISERFSDRFNILISGRFWMAITEKNATKGESIKYLQKRLQIKKSETVAIGDNFNDVPMFRESKYSFVPYYSNDDVKKEATYVIPGYEEDGPLRVLKAILKYGC